ncbi:cytoplasmic protein [Falsibacillus albus]|uniref:cytoplasmic protein n=1 Tax=Falsibacillus albus TaxID=2478915 RepID=UPI0011E5B981|nr:cytoplasmic protein [Falsibacillus albus]
MADIRNVSIHGSGSASGGVYKKMAIRGEGTILDDVECEQFKIFGSSDVMGNMKLNKFHIFGESSVKGQVDVEELKIFGTLSIGGDAQAHRAKVRGTLDIDCGLHGERADIKGMITTGGDLEVESLSLQGAFEVNGVMNAGSIDAGLRFGMSKADEIVGGKIKIKKKSNFPIFSFGKEEGRLESRMIEGDDIYLENTSAEVVRGKNIKIGTGCKIGLVEYSGHFEHKSNSVVKENKKI